MDKSTINDRMNMFQSSLKRRVFILLVLCSALSIFPLYAHKNVLGRLVDRDTGKPVKDARVTIVGTRISTISNELGYFRLQIQEKALVKVEAEGYNVVQAELRKDKNFTVELSKLPSP